jgi:hypothetical protein
MAPERRISHPSFWSAPTGPTASKVLDQDVRPHSHCRLTGGTSVRQATAYAPLAGTPAADRGRVSPGRVRDAGGAEQSYPWEEARARTGNFDFLRFDPVPVGSIRTASAPGAFTISLATAGNGRRPCSVRSMAEPMASIPGRLTFSMVSTRHEGGLTGDGQRTCATKLPQLVRAELSYVCAKFRTVK